MKKDIRELIIEELKKDLIGPRISDDETFWEWGGDKPLSRYVSGVLYPKQTNLSHDDFLKNTVEGKIDDDDDDDEEEEQTSSFTIAVGTQPSSIGITCSVLKQTEKIDVEINFAKYDMVERKPTRKPRKKNKESETDEEEKMEKGWKRRAVTKSFQIKLQNKKGEEKYLDEDAEVVYEVKDSADKYLVSVFLLNTNEAVPETYTEPDKCIFQPEIKLLSSKNSKTSNSKNIFQSMSNEVNTSRKKDEIQKIQFDLLFRNKKFFAAGRNCSVEWEIENKSQDSDSVNWVKTTFIPRYEIKRIDPLQRSDPEISKSLSNALLLKTLADVKEFSNYNELLSPVVSEYDKWIKNLEQKSPSIPKKFVECVNDQIKNCYDAKKRISDGIKLISTNDMAGQAFQFANEVMYDQMIYSMWAKDNIKNQGKVETDVPPADKYPAPEWRVFQLAYILLNIKSIVEPTSKEERETVDLLWFPTGGGKTEAYLGIVAFVLAMRRLREKEPNKYGVSVLMRYTYRLLTQQQFQRAAALMCSCERKRQKNPKKWGTEPFLVGLFVGDTTTPNYLTTAEKNLNWYKSKYPFNPLKEQNPVQIINCPRCGMKLTPHDYHISKNPKRMRVKCANMKCYFGDKDNEERFLPVVMTDDDIVSTLPSLLIGTVDKLARLTWEPRFAAIFGRVRRHCKKHGFWPANTSSGDLCKTCDKKTYGDIRIPLPPPELIIQDELHLISGTLGTLVGLYESIIEDLCLHNGIKPKIIASTATIKNSEDQIKWLFARNRSKIFPPQAFDFGETYFSKIVPEKLGKIHLGICATSVGGFTVDARVAAAVLRKVRYIEENKQKFDPPYTAKDIDPYYTLVSYYNTRRNHGSATGYYVDSVPPFMGTIRKKFEAGSKATYPKLDTTELTGRLDAGEIPSIFQRLEHPLYREHCICDDEIRNVSIKAKKSICQACKKPLQGVLDALLCTNMLSVGVDVQRLSLMIINGQPKGVAEYIQASGRIGRSTPGLVITNYNFMRARDLSVFENFMDFHSKYHKNVEPGTLTPFAARAREAGMFGMLVAFVRIYADQQNLCIPLVENKGASKFTKGNQGLTKLLGEITDRLGKRVDIVDKKEKNATINDFKNKIKTWFAVAEMVKANNTGIKLKYKRNYFRGAPPPSEDEIFLIKKIGDIDPPGYEGQLVQESLRQAEGSIRMYYHSKEEHDDNE